jgi:hypothetical protein
MPASRQLIVKRLSVAFDAETSLLQGVDSCLFFTPVMDVSIHSFGASIEFRPDQLDFAKLGRFVSRIHPN